MSDRKYKHKGYQDSGSNSGDSSRPQSPRPDPPRERLEGSPRGRTAGGFGPDVFKCNACGTQRLGFDQPTPEETCVKCEAPLHSCGNCRNFDTTATWECRENIPARVPAKHSKNECTFFSPKVVRDLAVGKGRVETPDDARKAFDALFKK